MNDGKVLRDVVDYLKNQHDITTSKFRDLSRKYIDTYYDLQCKREAASHVSMIVTAMKRRYLTIKRFFEFYFVLGYTDLRMTLTLNRHEEVDVIVVNIRLTTNKTKYGVYLKDIVNQLNQLHGIGPDRLSDALASWININFPDMSTADRDHRAGNLAKALNSEHITWKRLMDYLSLFDPTGLSLEFIATGGDIEPSTHSFDVDVHKRLLDEQKLQARKK